MKICAGCKEEKRPTEFNTRKGSRCRKCRKDMEGTIYQEIHAQQVMMSECWRPTEYSEQLWAESHG